MTKDALLEIGSEELPASFISIGMRQLKALADESLKASGVAFSAIDVHGTPRRLAVVIHGLAERSADQEKVVTGPPVAISKDAQGQWTPAALGFARKQGLKPSDLTIEKGRLSAVVRTKGVPAKQLLSDHFPQWITRLEFPKSMVWEPTKFRYPRPIRWLVGLYGSDLVPFHVAGVRSARWTLGLGPWSPKKIPIPQAGKYALLLKNQCVLVDGTVRQDTISRYAEQAVKRIHGHIHLSPALLEQVSNLVEHPVAILGNFDPAYLDLPKEVLVTCLEHHQKYFPVEESAGGKLLPHFVGIRNGMSVHQDIVREGYERVLTARLADARYFYDLDRRTGLTNRVEALKGVMFQEKLGTLYDKTQRIHDLIAPFAAQIPGSEIWRAKAETAAMLAKADLTTSMVGEFPELQGTMGRLYGEGSALDPQVSLALEEHYWPITLSGKLPSNDVGLVISLVDKLDTLVGDFAVGLIPTGSADPYGLRRAAVGVLRILEATKWSLKMEALIDQVFELQPADVKSSATEALPKLKQFMQQRFAAMSVERGFKSDEVEAVLAHQIENVPEAIGRMQALQALRDNKDFLILATVFKRSSNIVRQAIKSGIQIAGAGEGTINASLFEHEVEHELFQIFQKASREAADKVTRKDYIGAMKAILPVAVPLDKYFKDVMVMAEKQDVKQNRLSMMFWMTDSFKNVVDFSKLQNG